MNLIETFKKGANKSPSVDLFPDLSESDRAESRLRVTIAREIARSRKEMGLSQSDLAEMIDVSPSIVSQYESGDYNFTLKELCNVFTALKEQLKLIFQ